MCFSASPPGVASQDADESVDWFGRRGELCWQSNKGKAANKKRWLMLLVPKKIGVTPIFLGIIYTLLYTFVLVSCWWIMQSRWYLLRLVHITHRWWQLQNLLMFHPGLFGISLQFHLRIFSKMGWWKNHQLDLDQDFCWIFVGEVSNLCYLCLGSGIYQTS